MLMITNTLSGKKEQFKPLLSGKATLYVCGITPYDDAHVGHGRVYVSFDILYRLLQSLGLQVRYCRNLTDIDDKILNKAQKQFGDRMRYADITAPVIEHFKEDMNALNCLAPDFEPRVTDNIGSIIEFIEKLIIAEKAYVVEGDVYFRIRSFPSYGKLSKHKLEDLRAGERVAVDDRKEDPLDFALWKSEPEGEFWKSPWGYGRPGWHIECSALAAKFLGPQIDIHAGGLDLIFPHHENEIAQSEALLDKPFATYWMHNGFVQINQEKMSKSLGNFFTLRDIFAQFHPQVLRYYFINHHYKAPLEFSFQDLTMIQKNYQRLTKVLASVVMDEEEAKKVQQTSAVIAKMRSFVLDDLNTPGMLGVLFENLDSIKNNRQELAAVKLFLQDIVGMTCELLPETEVVITPEIEQLLQKRESARAAKDWATADAIRDQLKALGYEVQDKKSK